MDQDLIMQWRYALGENYTAKTSSEEGIFFDLWWTDLYWAWHCVAAGAELEPGDFNLGR